MHSLNSHFTHELRRSDSPAEYEAGGRIIAQMDFWSSFNLPSLLWLEQTAHTLGFTRWIANSSLPGGYFTNEHGDVLELR